ncbi:glutathione S-transferase, partial [Podospora didyma]
MATVDTSLEGQTSGAAARLAAAHSAEHTLKLYGGWFCPFVQRAWILLVEKRIPHQYIEINPYHKAPEFLALNPRGLVPTLAIAASKPLYESTIICEYLDEAFPDESEHGKRLLPTAADDEQGGGVYERARCRLWIDHICSRIVPCFYKFIQHTPDKGYTLEEVRKEFLGHLKVFVAEMDSTPGKGPWFLGERFSLVDVMLAPWAKRLFLIDHYKEGGVGIPGVGKGQGTEEDEQVWERWRRWFAAIVERPSVKETWSKDEQYVAAYKRYADDTTQSQVAKATRAGKSLP